MTQRTSTVIAAELAEFREARAVLVRGERIEDVWKDGRRMRFASMTLAQINSAIAELQREYDQAVEVEAGRPRRRAIGLAWKN